jgi:hypothetical protein
MSSIRTRLARLEQRLPPPGGINWTSLGPRPEDIVSDGIIDWKALCKPSEPWSAEKCPIERAIAAAGLPVLRSGSALPNAPAQDDRHLAEGDSHE